MARKKSHSRANEIWVDFHCVADEKCNLPHTFDVEVKQVWRKDPQLGLEFPSMDATFKTVEGKDHAPTECGDDDLLSHQRAAALKDPLGQRSSRRSFGGRRITVCTSVSSEGEVLLGVQVKRDTCFIGRCRRFFFVNPGKVSFVVMRRIGEALFVGKGIDFKNLYFWPVDEIRKHVHDAKDYLRLLEDDIRAYTGKSFGDFFGLRPGAKRSHMTRLVCPSHQPKGREQKQLRDLFGHRRRLGRRARPGSRRHKGRSEEKQWCRRGGPMSWTSSSRSPSAIVTLPKSICGQPCVASKKPIRRRQNSTNGSSRSRLIRIARGLRGGGRRIPALAAVQGDCQGGLGVNMLGSALLDRELMLAERLDKKFAFVSRLNVVIPPSELEMARMEDNAEGSSQQEGELDDRGTRLQKSHWATYWINSTRNRSEIGPIRTGSVQNRLNRTGSNRFWAAEPVRTGSLHVQNQTGFPDERAAGLSPAGTWAGPRGLPKTGQHCVTPSRAILPFFNRSALDQFSINSPVLHSQNHARLVLCPGTIPIEPVLSQINTCPLAYTVVNAPMTSVATSKWWGSGDEVGGDGGRAKTSSRGRINYRLASKYHAPVAPVQPSANAGAAFSEQAAPTKISAEAAAMT
ncbi:hypothetical protein AXF42_Ash006665 [Apostasia shenzhenica]|uniref:Uncharacterized protein n=1 Tax=Apostasia shenzhenica TaxID=1088818 RepID=A0A2I0AIS9_9ASPA|nr:hypothetical protein AXF42_Ash006665 [Apostasia shenzhenica]